MIDFSNDNRFKKIDEDIWVYENFLDEDELVYFDNVIKNITEEQWGSITNKISWYNNKVSPANNELEPVFSRIIDIVAPNYEPTKGLSFTRMFPGDEMHEHRDTCGEEEATSNDDFGTCSITRYGVVVYMNDNYEGGELNYTELGIDHKPKAGDLVIHGALISHRVKKVISGIRYAYATFLIDKNNGVNNA